MLRRHVIMTILVVGWQLKAVDPLGAIRLHRRAEAKDSKWQCDQQPNHVPMLLSGHTVTIALSFI
jgi:hypothetical protein